MSYWIIFNLNQDILVAKVDGREVERWWNKKKLANVYLDRDYSYSWIRSLHPSQIQEGIFLVAGFEANNISNFRITNEEITLEDIYGKL